MNRLTRILSLKRGYESAGERKMIEEEIKPYSPTVWHDEKTGKEIAYTIEVPKADGTAYPVLWSCHTDTVHREKSEMLSANMHNPVILDEKANTLYKNDGRPLGGDDGAGVWLLLEMVDAGVPGTYIFHRGEECGGIGSTAMSVQYAKWLGQFTHAIAFDRRGYTSIITHQGWGKCCSDEWAREFGDMLFCANENLILAADDGGIYTDTAEYVDIIAECSNISIGYDHEHTGAETLNLSYLFDLRNGMLAAFKDGPTMSVHRAPGDSGLDYAGWEARYRIGGSSHKAGAPCSFEDTWLDTADDVVNMSFGDLVEWCSEADPATVADLLMSLAEQIAFSKEVVGQKSCGNPLL